VPGERLRIVRPGAALALGLLTLVMLISAVVTGSVVDRALEPEHLTVWIRPGSPG
jgi:hypothetical protein